MRRQTLANISIQKIQRFLEEFANIRLNDEKATLSFARRFQDMLTDLPSASQWEIIQHEPDKGYTDERTLQLIRKDIEDQDKPVDVVLEHRRISHLGAILQSIWKAPTSQEKKFRIFGLHQFLSRNWDPAFLADPHLTFGHPGPFARTMLYLIENIERALICRNPDCPARFFFQRRKGQRYCSEKCSGVGQKIAKRKWWNEEGEIWRKKRQKKQLAIGKKKGNRKGKERR